MPGLLAPRSNIVFFTYKNLLKFQNLELPALSALQPAIVSFLLTNLTSSFGFSFFMKHTSESPGTFLGKELLSIIFYHKMSCSIHLILALP